MNAGVTPGSWVEATLKGIRGKGDTEFRLLKATRQMTADGNFYMSKSAFPDNGRAIRPTAPWGRQPNNRY